MLYCLDCYGSEGAPGKSGTSRTAMMFLSHWLDGFGRAGKLPISSRYLAGPSVYMGDSSDIVDALRRGGAAVVRLNFEGEHYVLLTGAKDGKIFMFDPYYQEEPFPEKDVIVTMDHPMEYNRIVPYSYFNSPSTGLYAMGDKDRREAVLLFNEDTKLTDEKTIEYFI
jgi:hypothetical protein